MSRELSFWLSIALVAIVANKLFTLFAASNVGGSIPGVRQLAQLGAS